MNTNLNIDHILLNDSKVPWFEIKNTNQQADIIHMSAANGFTATSYLEFLNFFSDQHSITGMDCRGTWAECETPPPSFKMKHFADDLIQAIEQQHHKPIIGMGHSQGGFVTLLAAIKRPDLFSKIVLIEPASLPYRWIDFFYPYIPKKLLFKLFPFMKGSLQRQRNWHSHQQFYDRYRFHNTYKRFTDISFDNYMNYGLVKQKDQQLQLSFSPQWEAHIFSVVEFMWKYLSKITIPTLLIRAEHSNLYTQKQFIKYNKNLPNCVTTQEIAQTFHLLPLEKPQKLSQIIKIWLSSNNY